MTESPVTGTILIVDDTPANLWVLLDYLGDYGFTTLVATDGANALEQIPHAQPDIILLDVVMPGIDGFETCRRLKANPDTADIPIIFMTALSDTVDKVRGFQAGAVDYVTKPFQHEEVLARLTAHLTIRNLQRSLEINNEQLQQEIGERKRIEAEQEQLIAELDAFAHTVAHDLKNPLAGLLAYAELLQTDWAATTERDKATTSIVEHGRKMANIIDELLLLAEMRQVDFTPQPLAMVAIVDEVLKRLHFPIEEGEAIIITPDAWPEALGYAPWVEEIWANYVSNALKYGGKPARIELGASLETEGWVRFWVRDNGAGLSVAAQAQLFTPFTRLGASTSLNTAVSSHGLGLSIVRRIAERLGGKVGVESQPGAGSMFFFTLPLSPSKV
jgi:two-component system, sensor histidine kinase and response regulator